MNTSTSRVGDLAGMSAVSAHGSAVSWGAIFAGAAAAAALSILMIILGTGLGMSAVSPWSYAGIGAGTLGSVDNHLIAALESLTAPGKARGVRFGHSK